MQLHPAKSGIPWKSEMLLVQKWFHKPDWPLDPDISALGSGPEMALKPFPCVSVVRPLSSPGWPLGDEQREESTWELSFPWNHGWVAKAGSHSWVTAAETFWAQEVTPGVGSGPWHAVSRFLFPPSCRQSCVSRAGLPAASPSLKIPLSPPCPPLSPALSFFPLLRLILRTL